MPQQILKILPNGEQYATVYEEVIRGVHSPEYSLVAGASRVRRTVDVAWDNRTDAVRCFLGFPRVMPYGPLATNRYITRALPDYMRDFKNNHDGPYLWATQIEKIEGIGPLGTYDVTGVAEYEKARLTVIYEAVSHGIFEDRHPKVVGATGFPDESKLFRYVTIAFKPSAEFITLPRGYYFWVAEGGEPSGNKMDFGGSKLLPSIEIHFIWRQVPVIPTAAQTQVGCVNNAPFTIYSNSDDSAQITYATGTLLLLGVDLNRYKLASGDGVFDITYRMKYFEPEAGRGHNYFLRYLSATNQLAYRRLNSKADGNENNVFASKDFSLLFQPY